MVKGPMVPKRQLSGLGELPASQEATGEWGRISMEPWASSFVCL